MPNPIVLAGLIALALALPLLWYLLRSRRRDRSLERLLDLADEMQALLDRSQERMQAMQSVVGRVPADIAAVAHASLDSTLPIREAKRDVLQHRLWIQKHGDTATQAELDTACAALDRARTRLSAQLTELERAGAELAEATEASAEAARREPPTLRRDPG
ncbi:hypothetical protein [Arenimonas sp. MALMAid1274]|uniref:hypothetical protein n=1 Tax=Arenimonas sp. MALMAid1274 TaxID=3411630 RepID=UPI003BA141A4